MLKFTRKNQIIAALVMACVLLGTVGATGALADVSLSLEESIELGIKNNPQVSLLDLTIESAKVNVAEVESSVKSMNKILDSGGNYMADTSTYQVLYILPAQAQFGYDHAVLNKAFTLNSIKYNVESAYYNLQLAEKSLEINRLAMKRSEDQFKSSETKEKQGQVSRYEVITAESNYITAQTNYESARNNVLACRRNLNQWLGQDIETPIILKEEIAFEEGEPIDLNQAIQDVKLTNANYFALKGTYEIAKLTKTYEQQYYFPNTYIYQRAGIQAQSAEHDMKTLETTLEIAVRNSYNRLETAAANYTSLSSSVELSKKALELASLRYREGLGTIYDVQDADLNYQGTELNLLNAIYSYNLAKASFKYQIYY